MSSTQKFNVGDRVRVVKDEYWPKSPYVGRIGEVDYISGVVVSYPYRVVFDENNLDWYAESDLVAVNVKVIEGIVKVEENISRDVDEAYVGDVFVNQVLFEYEGDEVRITIEVLRKAGESK